MNTGKVEFLSNILSGDHNQVAVFPLDITFLASCICAHTVEYL
jgi:hypothetical protein